MIQSIRVAVVLSVAMLSAPVAHADLYTAEAAYQRKDFTRAFELYRELAELGQPVAQETVAIMYVQGEGVTRDNALGYAWATVAQTSGGTEATRSIIAQLESHMNEAARRRAQELVSKFGKQALQMSLLPDFDARAGKSEGPGCRFKMPASPDQYYPHAAIDSGTSGFVLMEIAVWPDGRAHDPQVWYALPERTFDEPSRRAIQDSTFEFLSPEKSRPCRLLTSTKFLVHPGGPDDDDWKKQLLELRGKALHGDPRSQLQYGYMLSARSEFNVEKDRPDSWYVKAAQAGIPGAQFMTGLDLLNSASPSEKAKGLAWLNKAADNGSPDAQVALALDILRGTPDAAGVASAQALLERATAANDVGGQIYGGSGRFYLSALLAAGPEGAKLDAARALQLIDKIRPDMPSTPTVYEIRAAAQAALGKFDDAQDSQRKALGMAKKLGWDTGPQKVRLDAYAHQHAWRGNFLVP